MFELDLLLGRWDRRQNLARDFSPMARRNRGMIPWRSLTKGLSRHSLLATADATTPAAKSTAKNVVYPTARAVSQKLAARYGAGLSETTLQYFRKFYQVYVDRRPQIPRPTGVESVPTPSSTAILPIRRAAGDESLSGFSPQLSWSHYRALMRVEKAEAREFYERESGPFSSIRHRFPPSIRFSGRELKAFGHPSDLATFLSRRNFSEGGCGLVVRKSLPCSQILPEVKIPSV